jgi:hypothetical protein
MALGQVVIPGFALFHLGIEAPAPKEAKPAEADAARTDDADPNDMLRSELSEERPE